MRTKAVPASKTSGGSSADCNMNHDTKETHEGKHMAQKMKEQLDDATSDKAGLQDYQLGDCLGKGAFGAVYRALNWGTGETVAVKQIKLADLPKADLRVIMLEIDLLKNLHHSNIVKYHGFVKSTESLYIILEYCENGSLHSICKNFGKFPESLVALYMSQVLHGLHYLHEQGVIHRDIKGANILTTKEGVVKLADFGVATKAAGLHESAVVGTPYWMAPEVIELSGATTASDIWSLGCTVIELLDGKPPYHKLQPMPALFRIVNDDHPPLPETASPTVQDFLMQCFQKDPNLRVSAKKLLKHPWIMNARRADTVIQDKPTKYAEAVKSVQQWNEALKSPGNTVQRVSREGSLSPIPFKADATPRVHPPVPAKLRIDANDAKHNAQSESFTSPISTSADNWDDDFESSISASALQLPQLHPIENHGTRLSAEKLKALSTAQHSSTKDKSFTFESESNKARQRSEAHDDLSRTVKPEALAKSVHAMQQPLHVNEHNVHQTQPRTRILRTPIKHTAPGTRPNPPFRSSSKFREDPVEDYSDLITEDDVSLDKRFHQILEAKQHNIQSPKFTHMSDLKSTPKSTKSSKAGGSLRDKQSPPANLFEKSVRRTRSSVEISQFFEKVEDEDFSDIFGMDGSNGLVHTESDSGSDRAMLSMLNSKFSNASWMGDEEDEDDPFAQLEENLNEMDLETKVARDKHVRLCSLVEGLIGSLKTTQPEEILEDVSDQLLSVLFDSPGLKSAIISSHGLLPILEVLEYCQQRHTILQLLKIINIIILDSVEIQENFCFVGGIPVVTKFAHKKYPSEIRLEAAAFVRQMYQTSTLTLQMFISCGGLNVLVEFLEEDYEAERDLVLIGVNGVWSVFELQGPTPKNDFCRIFSRSTVLYPLSLVLNRVLDEEGELTELVEGRIVNIFFLFSQAENYVKESIADRMVLKRVLKDLRRMAPSNQITMLKFIKNLSMLATTLDALQNSNAIEVLTDLLSSSMRLPHFREMSNQILNIMFNLCRLSKTRQEDAALNGIIPLLQRIVKTERPLKEFALPILCDMAHSGKVGRKILWQNKGLGFYISLLADPYWQVTALDAIFIWLQEETAKVEEHLLDGHFSRAIVECFLTSKADAFENLLEPLQKLLRLSPPIAATLAHADLFNRTAQKLHNKKAVVRGNLLRIIRSICDATEEHGELLSRFGLYEAVEHLADSDPAILVRNMAADLIRSNGYGSKSSYDAGRYRPLRRTSSATGPPTPLHATGSQPTTPQQNRTIAPENGYFDLDIEYTPTSRPHLVQSTASNISQRPTSRDTNLSSGNVAHGGNAGKAQNNGNSPTPGSNKRNIAAASPSSVSASKSRLPLGKVARPPRMHLGTSRKIDENPGASAGLGASPVAGSNGLPMQRANLINNPRRRRQTSTS